MTTSHTEQFSRATLHRRAKSGDYTRIARGIYRPADAPPASPEWIEAATRSPHATICLASALAHHSLTDTIPDTLEIALPRGTRPPATDSAITWRLFDAGTFDIGRTQIPIPGTDMSIGLYSPERTLVDAFRLRGLIGYEMATEALKTWLGSGGKPARLAEIAVRLPRARGPVMRALEYLS
jgi:predicted transcriptional regulator of viral defense system